MQKTKKLTKGEILELVDLTGIEPKNYSHEDLIKLFKEEAKMPNANATKNVLVVIELSVLNWLYFITGYTKGSDIMFSLVKGFATEAGSGYLKKLVSHPLRVKVLERPIPLRELFEIY